MLKIDNIEISARLCKFQIYNNGSSQNYSTYIEIVTGNIDKFREYLDNLIKNIRLHKNKSYHLVQYDHIFDPNDKPEFKSEELTIGSIKSTISLMKEKINS